MIRCGYIFSYLTNQGDVYMDRVQKILNGLGEVEDEIFKNRQVSAFAFILWMYYQNINFEVFSTVFASLFA